MGLSVVVKRYNEALFFVKYTKTLTSSAYKYHFFFASKSKKVIVLFVLTIFFGYITSNDWSPRTVKYGAMTNFSQERGNKMFFIFPNYIA